MLHHDSRDYQTAKSNAAVAMRDKLEKMFTSGRQSAVDALSRVRKEQPKDYVVPKGAVKFKELGNSVGVSATHSNWTSTTPEVIEDMGIHWHARNQIGQRLGIPKVYSDRLMEQGDWGRKLLIDNLNELNTHSDHDKYLLRTVNGDVRGWLSDRFKRMDSAPIISSLVEAVSKVGAVPLRGIVLDTKVNFSFILPMMFEPIKDEVIAFGIEFRNSDYGHGRLLIQEFMYRMLCTNLMAGVDYIKKTHLGSRLTEDVSYQIETHEADNKALGLAVHDVVMHALSPDNVNKRVELIAAAAEEKSTEDIMSIIKGLRSKSKINKGEADKISEMFRSTEIKLLPPGNSNWRLSNAISLLSQGVDDPYRMLELENMAGEVAGFND